MPRGGSGQRAARPALVWRGPPPGPGVRRPGTLAFKPALLLGQPPGMGVRKLVSHAPRFALRRAPPRAVPARPISAAPTAAACPVYRWPAAYRPVGRRAFPRIRHRAGIRPRAGRPGRCVTQDVDTIHCPNRGPDATLPPRARGREPRTSLWCALMEETPVTGSAPPERRSEAETPRTGGGWVDGVGDDSAARPQCGKIRRAIAPPPAALAKSASPPCTRATSRTKASPSPVLFLPVAGRGSE